MLMKFPTFQEAQRVEIRVQIEGEGPRARKVTQDGISDSSKESTALALARNVDEDVSDETKPAYGVPVRTVTVRPFAHMTEGQYVALIEDHVRHTWIKWRGEE